MSHPSTIGPLVLFGSGETGKHGRLVQEKLLLRLKKPVRVTIVETPAGFQPNVDIVTGKIKYFYEFNLQNFKPIVTIADARRKGGPHDSDDPVIAAKIDDADVVFCGPGSPTYAARHLSGTATLRAMRERWHAGATMVLASAAAIACSAQVVPIYEIFRVGEDPEWRVGLDLLSDLGLRCVVIPHWNNTEGGADLDTSCCFLGADRFAEMLEMLPPDIAVLGIDEHTAVVIDPSTGIATVQGAGTATTIIAGERTVYPANSEFAMSLLAAGA